ncbi:hypothetical protein BSKO_11856 [Bryopsis sp. KO-2023]|nr:hypothetical protein BSKO_11856 [Bryopsis sp. KO-2023]
MEDAQIRVLIDRVCRRLRDLRTALRMRRTNDLGLWDITQYADRIDRIIRVLDHAEEVRAEAAGEGQGGQVEGVDENREDNTGQQRRGVVRAREEAAQEAAGDDDDDVTSRMRKRMKRTLRHMRNGMRLEMMAAFMEDLAMTECMQPTPIKEKGPSGALHVEFPTAVLRYVCDTTKKTLPGGVRLLSRMWNCDKIEGTLYRW